MSELTKALIQFHKDVGVIEKNAKAQYGKFADLCGVLSTVTPALLKNNLVITQEFLDRQSRHHPAPRQRRDYQQHQQARRDRWSNNELHSWGPAVTYTHVGIRSAPFSASWLTWTWTVPCSKSRLSPPKWLSPT